MIVTNEEDTVGILGSILGRPGKGGGYCTIDGGHPAPYPDMTDEQLYNYEIAFNVPHRTFDRPPSAVTREAYLEPYLDSEPMPEAAQQAWEGEGTDVREEDMASTAEAAPQEQDQRTRQDQNDHGDQGDHGDYGDRQEPPEHLAQQEDSDYGHAQAGAGDAPGMPFVAPPELGPALDFSRPIRTITTRQPVEILTTRARHPIYKVHAYIGDDAVLRVFTLDGRLSETGPRFLENIPEVNEVYLNIYLRQHGGDEPYRITQHADRLQADASAGPDRLACVRVELGSGAAERQN